jgi:PEGA domain-containing protein
LLPKSPKIARSAETRSGTTVAFDSIVSAEVPVKFRSRIIAAACVIATALLMTSTIAHAQGRRAVRVVRPSRVIVAGSYYRPFFYDPWYFNPYWYPYTYYGYGGYYDINASVRLQVEPRETEVFVDGYYAGTVDEFDGIFQRLHLEPGEHNLQLYLPGHRSVERKIYLQPGRTFRVHQTMQPLGGGEAEPVKPTPRQAPTTSAPPRAPQTRPGAARPLPRRSRERDSNVESRFGSLALQVQPGNTTVMIDGERWEGASDDAHLVIQLEAGVHRVEIQRDGYRPYSGDITIRSGETATLNIALTRQ